MTNFWTLIAIILLHTQSCFPQQTQWWSGHPSPPKDTTPNQPQTQGSQLGNPSWNQAPKSWPNSEPTGWSKSQRRQHINNANQRSSNGPLQRHNWRRPTAPKAQKWPISQNGIRNFNWKPGGKNYNPHIKKPASSEPWNNKNDPPWGTPTQGRGPPPKRNRVRSWGQTRPRSRVKVMRPPPPVPQAKPHDLVKGWESTGTQSLWTDQRSSNGISTTPQPTLKAWPNIRPKTTAWRPEHSRPQANHRRPNDPGYRPNNGRTPPQNRRPDAHLNRPNPTIYTGRFPPRRPDTFPRPTKRPPNYHRNFPTRNPPFRGSQSENRRPSPIRFTERNGFPSPSRPRYTGPEHARRNVPSRNRKVPREPPSNWNPDPSPQNKRHHSSTVGLNRNTHGNSIRAPTHANRFNQDIEHNTRRSQMDPSRMDNARLPNGPTRSNSFPRKPTTRRNDPPARGHPASASHTQTRRYLVPTHSDTGLHHSVPHTEPNRNDSVNITPISASAATHTKQRKPNANEILSKSTRKIPVPQESVQLAVDVKPISSNKSSTTLTAGSVPYYGQQITNSSPKKSSVSVLERLQNQHNQNADSTGSAPGIKNRPQTSSHIPEGLPPDNLREPYHDSVASTRKALDLHPHAERPKSSEQQPQRNSGVHITESAPIEFIGKQYIGERKSTSTGSTRPLPYPRPAPIPPRQSDLGRGPAEPVDVMSVYNAHTENFGEPPPQFAPRPRSKADLWGRSPPAPPAPPAHEVPPPRDGGHGAPPPRLYDAHGAPPPAAPGHWGADHRRSQPPSGQQPPARATGWNQHAPGYPPTNAEAFNTEQRSLNYDIQVPSQPGYAPEPYPHQSYQGDNPTGPPESYPPVSQSEAYGPVSETGAYQADPHGHQPPPYPVEPPTIPPIPYIIPAAKQLPAAFQGMPAPTTPSDTYTDDSPPTGQENAWYSGPTDPGAPPAAPHSPYETAPQNQPPPQQQPPPPLTNFNPYQTQGSPPYAGNPPPRQYEAPRFNQYTIRYPDGSASKEEYSEVTSSVQRIVNYVYDSVFKVYKIADYFVMDRNTDSFAIRIAKDMCYVGNLDTVIVDSFTEYTLKTRNATEPIIYSNERLFYFKEIEQVMFSDVNGTRGEYIAGSCGDAFMFRVSMIKPRIIHMTDGSILPGSTCPYGQPLKDGRTGQALPCPSGYCQSRDHSCDKVHHICCPKMPTSTRCMHLSIGKFCVSYSPHNVIIN